MRKSILFLICFLPPCLFAQTNDSLVGAGEKVVTLSEVVVSRNLNVPYFMERVREDSSFYKSFRNLRILGYTAVNDIRMFKKNGEMAASLQSTTRQLRKEGCRSTEVLEERSSGDMFDGRHEFTYYTAEMYASLFFTRGTVCGETNIIGDVKRNPAGKTGMDKRREQLKMLFFDPGKRIPGLPFVSGKTELFDKDLASCYDMRIDYDWYHGSGCYVFTQSVKPGKEDRVVINEMKTWFRDSSMEVLARNYSMSYDAGLFDFEVIMEVEMGCLGNLTVPNLIRYRGNWKVPFRRRERGLFTTTLSDFGY